MRLLFILKFLFYFSFWVCVYVCVDTCTGIWMPRRPEEGTGSPGAGTTQAASHGHFWTPALCNSGKCSYPLRHPSSSCLNILKTKFILFFQRALPVDCEAVGNKDVHTRFVFQICSVWSHWHSLYYHANIKVRQTSHQVGRKCTGFHWGVFSGEDALGGLLAHPTSVPRQLWSISAWQTERMVPMEVYQVIECRGQWLALSGRQVWVQGPCRKWKFPGHTRATYRGQSLAGSARAINAEGREAMSQD